MREELSLPFFKFEVARRCRNISVTRISLTVLLVGWIANMAPSKAVASEGVVLDTYTCAELLQDIAEPADGGKLLRSMMMITWAAGYAAAYQQGVPRSDANAVQLIAFALGDACRKSPKQLAVAAATETVIQFSAAQKTATDTSQDVIENKQASGDRIPREASRTQTAMPKSNPVPGGLFNTFENFDILGGDLKTLKQVELPACTAACLADHACRAYSFDRWNRFCFLKSNMSALVLDPSSVTGVKQDSEDAKLSTAAVRMDRRFNRSLVGVSSTRTAISNVDECESACLNDTTCVGITFEKSRGVCSVLSSINTIKNDRNMIGGIKTQSPP